MVSCLKAECELVCQEVEAMRAIEIAKEKEKRRQRKEKKTPQ